MGDARDEPGQEPDVDVELIFDFDGTITTEDTISSLAKAAIEFQVERGGRPRAEMETAWEGIQQKYVDDLQEHQRTYRTPTGKPPETPLDAAIARIWPVRHAETLSDIMVDRLSGRQRRHVELASLARVKDEGLFKGIWPSYLFNAGQQDRLASRVRLREGFAAFIAGARDGHDMHILSVNWSDSYIKGVLSDYEFDSVLANRTDMKDGNISATRGAFVDPKERGFWPEILTVGRDKLVVLRNLYWRKRALKPHKAIKFIYFGDSTTDLECLAEVGGVVMSSDGAGGLLTMIRQVLGFYIPHVSEWKEDNFLCWARDFAELRQFDFLERKRKATRQEALSEQR